MIFFTNNRELLTSKNICLLRPEFSPMGQVFTKRAPIFIAIIDVWPRANWEMVTNNLTTVIDVAGGGWIIFHYSIDQVSFLFC